MVTLKESFNLLEKEETIDLQLKEEIKNEVFRTLDRMQLFSDVFDLFTVNFFQTGNDFFDSKK